MSVFHHSRKLSPHPHPHPIMESPFCSSVWLILHIISASALIGFGSSKALPARSMEHRLWTICPHLRASFGENHVAITLRRSSLQHRQMAISFRAPSETKQKLISGLDNNAASIIANCPPRITQRPVNRRSRRIYNARPPRHIQIFPISAP